MKRMIRYLLLATLCALMTPLFAQQTDIQFEIENYDSDTLIFAYYMADKILVVDTLYSENQKNFRYQQDTMLTQGMYVVVQRPSGNYYQMILDDKDQQFSVSIDAERDIETIFDGSSENEEFYSYMRWLQKEREEITKINTSISQLDSTATGQIKALNREKEDINARVVDHQNKIINDAPNSITSILIKSNLPFVFPEFTGTDQEKELQKYHYYKKRYFDNVPLDHPAMLRTPIIDQRVNYYLNKLTPQVADSIIQSVDYILSLMEPAPDTYRYYLSNLLTTYGNSKYIGMDAIYVHLALNYYGKGKAPWIKEDNLRQIVSQARKIEPTLIGKKAADFTIQKQDSTDVSLSDFTTDYTVLVFWKPDCPHCTKAMPYVVDFNEKYKDQSVSVMSICTKTGEDYGKCWEGVKAKNMGTLLNAGDEFHRSRIFSRYNVTSTPMIYILDKDKNIKLKKVPAENLDKIMQEIMRIDAAEGGMN